MPATRKRSDRELKAERIELRVRPSAKKVIKRAMAVSGLSAADLAYEGALSVLDRHQRIVLAGRDRAEFLDLILNPPPPAPKLVAAIKRHRRVAL